MTTEPIEVPRTNDLLASLAVAIGLPLIMLAGIFHGFRLPAFKHDSAMLASTTTGAGPSQGPVISPEFSAMQARLEEAEQRNAMLDAELEKLTSEISQARDEARLARQEQAEVEIVHRERLQGFAYQVAGMTQRLADGRDGEAKLRSELMAVNERSQSLEKLATERGNEITRLKGEVAALTEIGKTSQTRLVAVQNLADARKRDADQLTGDLAKERNLLAQTRGELTSARALVDQQLAQIGRLEADRKSAADSFAAQILEKNQSMVRRDQRIGSLERSLEEARNTATKQAAALESAESTIGGLRQAVTSLSSGLVK